MKLEVCICTHNPRPPVFRRVLEALARQTLPPREFRVVVIDNCSSPPLTDDELQPLRNADISCTVVRDPRLGIIHARETAAWATTADWVVFVDDDNELFDDYLQNALDIASVSPCFGCFGGKLLLPPDVSVATWAQPLLPYLAIKDCGDEPVSRYSDRWGIWEPPTAGAVVRRDVLDRYIDNVRANTAVPLGRKGRSGLLSAEDSLMMRGAIKLRLQSSYQPRLKLWHHLDPERFRFFYLLRLFYAYGRSNVLLEHALGNPIRRARKAHVLRLLATVPGSREDTCRLALRWGFFVESLRREPSPAKARIPIGL